MQKPGSQLRALPRAAWQPTWARYGTWAALALLGIALADGALFLIHDRAADWVDHSRAVVATARDARLRIADRRAAIDVFINSRDPALLAADARARRDIARELDSLITLTAADSASQQHGAQAIAQAYREWDSAYAAPALASNNAGAALKASGPALFAPLNERFAEFVAAQDALYQSRRNRDRLLSLLTLVATGLPIALLASATLAARRRLQAKGDAILGQQAQLEEQTIKLAAQVEQLEFSNRELAEANADTQRARDDAERALAQRDRVSSFFDTALQSSPIGFAFLTTELRYVRVNARLAAARQLQPEDFVGHTVMEMASTPAAGATAVTGLRHVIQTGRPVVDSELIGASGGEQRRYLITYFPIGDAFTELAGVGMVVTDTTERSALEEQYRQSQKMEALGRLAGGVAHDFRNLLTVIRSYCDLAMLETADSDPRRRELLEIRGAADRAANLARQLLTFGRPQPLLAVELDVNDGVHAVENMLRRTAPRSVKVETRLGAHLGKVLVDPGHVEQVLMNLAINAIDAMPDGGRLTFETANAPLDEAYTRNHPGVAPGQYIMLSVSDTGVGMDDATLARIYEPFFTTKPPGKGTGLGLATVYGIVRQCGGHSWVHSEPGQGTTFKIYFPRLVPAREGAGEARPARQEPVRAESAETVLVVEDDVAVRGSLMRILKKFGYQVLEAEHGADALRIARAHEGPIHLAISDLMMPEMSGREFGERLGSARPETRVLFMSGYADEDVLQRGLVGEHQAFIQKPFAIEDITRKVHDVLRASV